jgi:thymidylate kinase
MDYERLLREIDRCGIRFALLHGWNSLSRERPSDLDLVVDSKSLPLLEEFLRAAYRIVQVFHYEATGFAFVLRDTSSDGRCAIVDVTTDYRCKGRIFLSEEELLQERRPWNGYWVAAPEREFSYLLAKKICEKGSLPETQREHLRVLAAHLGRQAYTVAGRLFGADWAGRVVRWITAENWSQFDSHLPAMRRAIERHSLRRDLSNPVRYWSREIARLWHRWRSPTGLFVAVLGSDGAGKSTLIQSLEGGFQGAFRRVKSFHFRPRFLRAHPSTTIAEPHAKPPYSRPRSSVKLLYYLLDYVIGYWLRVRPALARSTLVVFDRYYDDLLVDSRRYRYGGPDWLLRAGRRLVPLPHLVFVIDAPENQLIRRKTELPLEELKRQRARFRELAGESDRFIFLDGTAPIEEVTRQAMESIFAALERRCRQRGRFVAASGREKKILGKGDIARYENIDQTTANSTL